MKKGQVTIFIVIALILVVAILAYFMIRTSLGNKSVKPDKAPIYNYVISCIEETGYFGVYSTILNGNLAKDYIYEEGIVPYFYHDNLAYYNSKEEVEESLASYINFNLKECIDKLENISGYEISYGSSDIKAKINERLIIIKAKFPIYVKKGETTLLVKDFEDVKIYTDLGLLYNIALNITNTYIETNGFSLTYSSQIYDDYGIRTDLKYYPDYSIVSLIDDKGIENNYALVLRFALT